MLQQDQINVISDHPQIVKLTQDYRRQGLPATDFFNEAIREVEPISGGYDTAELVELVSQCIIAKAEDWNENHRPKTPWGKVRYFAIKVVAAIAPFFKSKSITSTPK